MTKKGIPFDPSNEIPSLAGKVILITGGNLGLGKQTALDLAKHNPSQLWIAARGAETGSTAVTEIKKASPEVSVHFLHLDLASFTSVKNAAQTFLASVSRLDILYLNAGIMGGPHVTTEDGYERQFGINHMGHALLFKLLKPLLLNTAARPASDVRVVVASSAGHRFRKGKLIFETFKSTAKELSPLDKYCQSKLANVVYTCGLAKHVPEVTAVAVYPGDIRTGLFTANGRHWLVAVIRNFVLPFKAVSVEEGVKNQLWAGTAKGLRVGRIMNRLVLRGSRVLIVVMMRWRKGFGRGRRRSWRAGKFESWVDANGSSVRSPINRGQYWH